MAPHAEVPTGALQLADLVSSGAPLAVQAGKTVARGIVDGAVPSEAEGWELTEKALARLSTSTDTIEGIMAFVEKRDPRWSGK